MKLEVAGDHDWFAIQIENYGDYQFNFENLTSGNAYLYLRDAEGNVKSCVVSL